MTKKLNSNKLKKQISTIIIFIVIISSILVFYNYNSTNNKINNDNNEIKIGALLPLTGSIAIIGQDAKKGIDLAQKEINENGGINGQQLKILYEDSKNNPQESISAIRKLMTIDHADFYLASSSAVVRATQPIANEANKPYFMSIGFENEIAIKNKYTYFDYMNIENNCKAMAEEILQKRYKEVGILALNVDGFDQCRQLFKESFTKGGGNILLEENYQFGEKDFQTYFLKFKNKNANALVILEYLYSYPHLLEEMTKVYTPELIALNYAAEPAAKTKFTDTLFEEVTTIGYYPEFDTQFNLNNKAKNFVQNYKNTYGVEPNYNAAYGYEIIYEIAQVLSNCNKNDIECIDRTFSNMEFNGILGKVKFSKDGTTNREANIIEYQNGKWVKIN